MAPTEEPVLFLWSFSPWAGKVVAYLALRGIPHARCEQPIVLPRPDLAALGLKYRRIPVLAIGRDIYCDTLLILEKLEELYPSASSGKENGASTNGSATHYKGISARNPTEYALEKLFEKWTDACVFSGAAVAIPADMDLMKDPAFQKDREELWGRPWTKEEQDRLRPNGLAQLRADFGFLESVLADGRTWIGGGSEEDGPRLVDVHACWIFDWLFQLPGAYDEHLFNAKTYPRVFAWRERYFAAIAHAKEHTPNPPTELKGPDAVSRILSAPSDAQATALTVEQDPTGLKEGEEVEMWPADTGYNFKDKGTLCGLTEREVVIRGRSQQDGKEVRIHYPRWNFKIQKVQ